MQISISDILHILDKTYLYIDIYNIVCKLRIYEEFTKDEGKFKQKINFK